METREYRCIGPPGCGKTTYLSRQVEAAVEKHGSDSVLVMSLTRAAAAEVAGRDLPISSERIGTLHSHAFRSLGTPKIANDHAHLAHWNDYVEGIGRQHWRLSAGLSRDDFGRSEDGTVGDELFTEMDTCRARLRPRDEWPARLQAFAEAWEDWKERSYFKDFNDLLDLCLKDVDVAPGNPRFIFLDEAQDFSQLELALARKWAQHAEKLVTAGDPDQCLYTWRGADPKNFISPEIPEAHYRELGQSYRVPKRPHEVALSWIRQIKKRRDVTYLPREEEGSVRKITDVYRTPELVFQDAEKYLAQGKTVMFLATASYFLKPMLWFLREEGIPFHNPYVEKRGDWNPLRTRRGTKGIAERLKAFLTGGWLENPEELCAWLELLKLDHFRSDRSVSKQVLAELRGPLTSEKLTSLFQGEALQKALLSDLEWLRAGLLKEYSSGARASSFDYACRIAKKYGESALGAQPQVVIGTVHSVKGGEADVVYVFPDLSRAAGEEYLSSPEGWEASVRLMYVAFTRAKEHLVLCDPGSGQSIDFPAVA